MRRFLWTIVGIAGIAMLDWSSAQGGTLIPVIPVPGSTETAVFGINDSNIIVGGYLDSGGIEHGFFGTLDGHYTTFDYGGSSTGTLARAINDDGYITGQAFDPNFAIAREFLRKPDGTIVTIEKDGVPLDGYAQGITKTALSVGDYLDVNTGIRYGYYAKKGKYKEDLTLPFDTTRTAPRGINDAGSVVGSFMGDDGHNHGFLLQSGIVTTFDYPDPKLNATLPEGINDNGLVTGIWTDTDGGEHGFTLDTTTGTFANFKVKGASLVDVWGVNKAGFIAVATDIGSFIYCPKAKRKCPVGDTHLSAGD